LLIVDPPGSCRKISGTNGRVVGSAGEVKAERALQGAATIDPDLDAFLVETAGDRPAVQASPSPGKPHAC